MAAVVCSAVTAAALSLSGCAESPVSDGREPSVSVPVTSTETADATASLPTENSTAPTTESGTGTETESATDSSSPTETGSVTEATIPERTTVDKTVTVPSATKPTPTSVVTTTKTTTTSTIKGTTKSTTKNTTKGTTDTTTAIDKKKQWYAALMASENAWVASCQLANGAIAMTPTRSGKAEVNPYFADIAALSLLNQPDKYANKVKRYMDWHFAHLNTAQTDPSGVDGTIFDWKYTVSSGTVVLEEWLTTPPTYDSTDSYAATFLMVVNKYVQQTGDTAYAVKHAPKLRRVVNALFATMDDGLTMATPRSPVKLLMDNCEVYGGLQAAAELYRDVLIPAGAASAAEAERLEQAARNVATHVENEMWTGTFYRPSITQTGEPYHDFSWKDYYPCATAQTFPILYGLLDPASERAGKLYDQFCWRFDWENLNHPDSYWWGSNAYTAALIGDTERVDTYLTVYQQRVAASRGFPLYNADVAWVAMTAYYMSQQ